MQLRSHWWGMRFWKLLGKPTGMGLLFLLYCILHALFPFHFLLLWSEDSFQTQNRLKTLLRHQFLKRRVARSICLWPMDLIVQMSEKLLLISIRMILKCFGRQCLSKGIWRREGRGEKNRKCFHNKGYRSWKDCGKVSLKLLYLRARVLVGELTAEPRLLLSQGGAGAQQCALFQHYPCGTAAVAAIGFFHHYVSFLRPHGLFSSQRKKWEEPPSALPQRSVRETSMKYEILCGSVHTLLQAGKDCWLSSTSSSLWLSPHGLWAPPCCCSTWEAQGLLRSLPGLGDGVPRDVGELGSGESSWHSARWCKGDSYAGW